MKYDERTAAISLTCSSRKARLSGVKGTSTSSP
jgi:hypothetical protein